MEFAFYICGLIAILATLRVVTHTNPVHALLYLIISLLAIAGVFFSLGAYFAGALEIIVYAGAIMVLFVFVVMMLNLNTVKKREGFKKTLALALGLGALVIVQIGSVIFHYLHRPAKPNAAEMLVKDGSNTRRIGEVLYTQYALAFELAALVLLVALVAAVAITLRNRKGAKEQNPSKQAQTRAQDRLRMVNEAADVDARQTLVDQSVKSVNTQES